MSRIGHDRLRRAKIAGTAALPALALALLAGTPAGAQDVNLPSVSDYKLPTARPSPTVRPQGPVDSDAPVVRPAPPAETPAESASTPAAAPQADASPAAESQARSETAASPRPEASASGGTARPRAPAAASITPGSAPAATIAAPAELAPSLSAAAPGDTADEPLAPGIPSAWNVHSAKDNLASQALTVWPWLAALTFVLGAALMYLVQQALLRRRADRAAAYAQPWAAEEPPAAAEPLLAADEPARFRGDGDAVLAAFEPAAPIEAEPTGPVPVAASPAKPSAPSPRSIAVSVKPEPPVPPARPALDLLINPLDVTLAARRMSATLMNTSLNYELVVTNLGSETIGPIGVAGDMIAAHASLPSRSQLEIAGQQIDPLHRIESLAPGESVTLSGEFRLPLSAIKPIRSGSAALFVPLARFHVEALRKGAPPLVVTPTFVIGESPSQPGAALKPFRLDLGPRLYSHLGQREVALSA